MKKTILLLALFLIGAISSCKKEDESLTSNNPESLSVEEVTMLDNRQEAVGLDLHNIVLPNGEIVYDYLMEVYPAFFDKGHKSIKDDDPYIDLGPQDARNLLIAIMTSHAHYLTDRSKHQKPYEGVNKPAQNGLAYSWGGKDYTKRMKPPGPNTACSEEIYGLDCSGFIYQLFKKAGVNSMLIGANQQRKPEVIYENISNSIPSLDKIKVEDLSGIPPSDFESGDIVFWLNSSGRATHIGMVLKSIDGELYVYQSNGARGVSEFDCEKNMSTSRGSRILKLDNGYWFGADKDFGITRINAELSGTWELYLRCSGQTTNAITIELEFPTTNENNFVVTGTGIDYDDETINYSIDCQYDNAKNILSGVTYMTKPSNPSFYRYDSFSVKLDRDDTGYFSLILGDNVDAGCDIDGRLINLSVGDKKNLQNNLNKDEIKNWVTFSK